MGTSFEFESRLSEIGTQGEEECRRKVEKLALDRMEGRAVCRVERVEPWVPNWNSGSFGFVPGCGGQGLGRDQPYSVLLELRFSTLVKCSRHELESRALVIGSSRGGGRQGLAGRRPDQLPKSNF